MEFLFKIKEFLMRNKYISTHLEVRGSVHNLLEFKTDSIIHRKGSTQLIDNNEVVIPLSMSRGSLIVKANVWDNRLKESLYSSSHGAGRLYSRTDTLKYWYSMKKSKKDEYKERFSELLNKSGDFESSILQEFDFAYKSSDTILKDQPYLVKVDSTTPVCTVKFLGV
jgi:release factor H-coupled RctB family protein